LFQYSLGKPALERQIILDFNEASDDGVEAASAGPYANHLNFALDNYASMSLLIFTGCIKLIIKAKHHNVAGL